MIKTLKNKNWTSISIEATNEFSWSAGLEKSNKPNKFIVLAAAQYSKVIRLFNMFTFTIN